MASKNRPKWSLRDRDVAIPVLVFLVALALRLIGINWGLANSLHATSYHPDETVNWAFASQLDLAHFKLTPGHYNYGTLYLTLLKVISDVVFTYSGSPTPTSAHYWEVLSTALLVGRIFNAFFGAGTAVLATLMARRWTGALGSAFAGAMIAFAPAFVVHSRFATVDVCATFLLALSTFYALRLLPGPNGEKVGESSATQAVLLSALFAGLSAGVKYNGALGILTLFACLAFAKPRGLAMHALRAVAVAAIAFLVATPGAILDQQAFLRDFLGELQHSRTGHGLVFEATSPGFLYHLSNLMTGVGTTLTLFSLAALVYAAVKKKPWAIALLAFWIPYAIAIGTGEVKFIRYTFPLLIAMAIAFGWLIGQAHLRKGKWSIVVALGIFGLAGDTGGLFWTAQYSLAMAGTDARDEAATYLKSSPVGAGKTVGLVSDPWFYTPPIFPLAGYHLVPPLAIIQAMGQIKDPAVVRSLYPKPEERYDWDEHLLSDLKPDFVVFSNYESVDPERMNKAGDKGIVVQRYESFAQALTRDYQLDRAFLTSGATAWPETPDMMYVTPRIYVWRRKDSR